MNETDAIIVEHEYEFENPRKIVKLKAELMYISRFMYLLSGFGTDENEIGAGEKSQQIRSGRRIGSDPYSAEQFVRNGVSRAQIGSNSSEFFGETKIIRGEGEKRPNRFSGGENQS